ncbi:hypothetical protein ACWDYI_03795 [Nocardia beijingensis]
MTTSIDPALLARLSGEFTTLGTQLGVLGSDLRLLREQVVADISVRPAAPGTWGAGVPGETHPTSDRPGETGTEAVRGAESHAKGADVSGVMRESAFGTPAAGVPGDGGGSVSGVSGGVGAPGVARGLAFRTLGLAFPGMYMDRCPTRRVPVCLRQGTGRCPSRRVWASPGMYVA